MALSAKHKNIALSIIITVLLLLVMFSHNMKQGPQPIASHQPITPPLIRVSDNSIDPETLRQLKTAAQQAANEIAVLYTNEDWLRNKLSKTQPDTQ